MFLGRRVWIRRKHCKLCGVALHMTFHIGWIVWGQRKILKLLFHGGRLWIRKKHCKLCGVTSLTTLQIGWLGRGQMIGDLSRKFWSWKSEHWHVSIRFDILIFHEDEVNKSSKHFCCIFTITKALMIGTWVLSITFLKPLHGYLGNMFNAFYPYIQFLGLGTIKQNLCILWLFNMIIFVLKTVSCPSKNNHVIGFQRF